MYILPKQLTNSRNICSSILLIISALTFSFPNNVFAANSAMLELIEILHNKGSITDDEYSLLKRASVADQEQGDAEKQESQNNAEEKIQVATQTVKAADWASKVSLKGDVRLRFQAQKNDPGLGRRRGRVRYRLGIVAQPTSGWEVGAGLASGSSDLRSTNQSFDSTFSSKGINMDYAYAQYKLNDQFKAIGGKFKFANYLYTASDLMWDSDINPEGFSVNFTHNSELGSTFANSGIWLLEENGSSVQDPHMIYGQIGQRFGSDSVFGTLAGTFYNISDNPVLGSFMTEGINSDPNFGEIFSLSGEIGHRDLFGNGVRTSIVAEWVTNSDTTTSEDTGYLIGVKAAKGSWSLAYNYADLAQNAWPDIFPDSDRFDGLTGTKGHEVALTYAVMSNVAVGIDFYSVENEVLNLDQNLIQLDLNVKF